MKPPAPQPADAQLPTRALRLLRAHEAGEEVDGHDLQVARMLSMGTYGNTGRYRDPVSGRLFPRGRRMVMGPSRAERRRLERWRRTGRVSGHPHCPVVPDIPPEAT